MMNKTLIRFPKPVLIYPFVFAIFPVINLYLQNFDIVSSGEVLSIIIGLLLFTVIAWWGCYLLTKSYQKSALILTIFFILFFSFGQLLPGVANLILKFSDHNISSILLNDITTKLYLQLIAWIGIFILLTVLISRSKGEFKIINQFLNIVSITLVFFFGFQSMNKLITNQRLKQEMFAEIIVEQYAAETKVTSSDSHNSDLPNIYYIILDGYARADTLSSNFDYDNDEFFNYLRQSGFFIAENSYANYPITILSLSSTLNMDYLDDVPNEVGEESVNPLPVLYRIRYSQLFNLLEENGYEIIAFDSGYNGTDFTFVDQYYSLGKLLSNFQNEVIKMTPFYIWFHHYQYLSHRNRIEFTLDQLPNSIQSDQPAFVIAHILAPHPPFVFGSGGEFEYQDTIFTQNDGYQFSDKDGQREYIERYRNQLIYLNIIVEELITQILASYGNDSIIIIQSDHGSAAKLDFSSYENSDIQERLGILNAYYFPDQDYSNLYEDITPVNTFRVLLDQYLGTDLGLLEDRSYFSLMSRPYDFIDVTDELKSNTD